MNIVNEINVRLRFTCIRVWISRFRLDADLAIFDSYPTRLILSQNPKILLLVTELARAEHQCMIFSLLLNYFA